MFYVSHRTFFQEWNNTFGSGAAGLQWMQAISATFGKNGRECVTIACPFCKIKLTFFDISYTGGISPTCFLSTC